MQYYIFKTERGYVTSIITDGEKVYDCSYTNNAMMATMCSVHDTWYNEKDKIMIQNYLEYYDIHYQVLIFKYSLEHYSTWSGEQSID